MLHPHLDCHLMLKNAALCFLNVNFSIERLDVAQLGSYYVRGVGLPFVDSCKNLGMLVATELIFHGHIISIVGKSSGMSVNLLNLKHCRYREFMLTL